MSQAGLVRPMSLRGFEFDPSILSRIESQERGVMDVELQSFARCLKTTIARLCGERGRGGNRWRVNSVATRGLFGASGRT